MNKRDIFKENVSSELRALRGRFNLTQKEVANKADIDIMTVTRYENNTTSMQLDMLQKILSVYDVDIAIFFNNIYANMQNNN